MRIFKTFAEQFFAVSKIEKFAEYYYGFCEGYSYGFDPNPTMEQLCFRKVTTPCGININFQFGDQYYCD